MRYFHEPGDKKETRNFTIVPIKHPVYSKGTLFQDDEKGLIVVQKRYSSTAKKCWWGAVDDDLANDIYCDGAFKTAFSTYSDIEKNGNFPIIQVRKLMWAMRMKPLKREFWEEFF